MESLLNSSSAQPVASYTQLFAVAKQQHNMSTIESLWQAHYAYWENDILATGMQYFLLFALLQANEYQESWPSLPTN